MNLRERERELVDRYNIISDKHERLNALVGHQMKLGELPVAERADALLVQGCVSRVWLKFQITDGNLHVSYAAESVLVKGLVALLVELYQGAEISEAADYSPTLLESLGLDQMLSATRLQGLQSVIRQIRNAAHVD